MRDISDHDWLSSWYCIPSLVNSWHLAIEMFWI